MTFGATKSGIDRHPAVRPRLVRLTKPKSDYGSVIDVRGWGPAQGLLSVGSPARMSRSAGRGVQPRVLTTPGGLPTP
jgi:hypothetical protein